MRTPRGFRSGDSQAPPSRVEGDCHKQWGVTVTEFSAPGSGRSEQQPEPAASAGSGAPGSAGTPGSASNPESGQQSGPELAAKVRDLNEEIAALRRRLAVAPTDVRPLQRQLADTQERVRTLTERNDKLVITLRDARTQLLQLKEEVDRLAQPPSGYGTYLGPGPESSVEVYTAGRKMRLMLSPNIQLTDLRRGQQLRLNEALTVVEAAGFEATGEVSTLREVLGADRALVVGHADEERVVQLAAPLQDAPLKPGDSLLVDTKAGYAYERVPKAEVEDLVLEEVPDVSYSDIGGLGRQIEQIRDAVELPFLHAELFAEYQLRPPKGVLLYGPPGCGKTLIAKAVANSLAKQVAAARGEEKVTSYFLNIKGPELLNKYVGETERTIRLIFQRAREKASDGTPVIVFFDEMDSVFRTRGSGVSSDVETTIVPQLLSEIDGVEGLENVIVIGASNREDMIDPAILRPGRLDVKIKIERPDAESAKDIFGKYLTADLPIHEDDLAEFGGNRAETVSAMIQTTVERMYSESDDNRFLEVTYANGDKEILYFKDFNSGAMIQNIVDRAKKSAIKARIDSGATGLRVAHLQDAIVDEFAENEDLPNTTNPDDWARISGKKGERIVYIRTLVSGKQSEGSRSIDTAPSTGQYL
nr:proteasome ATPase [Nakamurella aerolata]